jgi:hypothetical protein
LKRRSLTADVANMKNAGSAVNLGGETLQNGPLTHSEP